MDLKKQMSFEIIEMFWSKDDAIFAKDQFEQIFQNKDFSNLQRIDIKKDENPIWIAELLKQLGVESSSSAKQLIENGAVSIDGQVIKDFKSNVILLPDMIIKIGKHKIYRLN